jgi:hypothetical protein
MWGRAEVRTLAAGMASGTSRIHDAVKKKAPERGLLRAQFFDDQKVRQGGQLCQTII